MISKRPAFKRYIAQTSNNPMGLEIVKASGSWLIDRSGKRYLDLISGISVTNTGHRPKKVIQAIRKQLGKYLHTMVFGEHIQAPQVGLASLLAKILPENLQCTYFVNSGSEAIEGALKLAKRFTGRYKIVAMRNAYHGSTHGALSLMSESYYNDFYRPLLPEVYFLDFNDSSGLELIDERTACVVIEPVQGEAGYLPADAEFLQALRDRCTTQGALLVFDEIQTGMGRCGSLFALQHYGISPDILCLAKAFGAGMPLGAFVSSPVIMRVLSHDPVLGHITTFGGHPLSCAAAYSNLRYVQQNRLWERAKELEIAFRTMLQDHSQILEITGLGAMIALHLKSAEQVQKVVTYCLDQGLMTDWFLYRPEAVRLCPPLTMSSQEIKRAGRILTQALDAL